MCDAKYIYIYCKKYLGIFLSNLYMIVNDSNLVPNSSYIFRCDVCDYSSSRHSQLKRHLSTRKHKMVVNGSKMIENGSDLVPKSSENRSCDCGNVYKYDSGYYRHKKKCCYKKDNNQKTDILDMSDKELIIMLVKQNSELINIVKNGNNNNQSINNHSNNKHSNNKTFNLQFFLNETCKDAMNIGDFVNSIKPQLNELEATGRLGYVEGVSNIILNNLRAINTQTRPIHCADQKREIMYIKDNNNEWTKEDGSKPILTNAIKKIANENIKNISEWRKKNPDCTDSESRKNNTYLKIVSNSMSGSSAEESHKNMCKIISNVAKGTVIEK